MGCISRTYIRGGWVFNGHEMKCTPKVRHKTFRVHFSDETKKERHASVPLWMFTQRNNPYCVYPSNFVGTKVVLFYEITKYFRKNLYISCIFCNFAAKLESLCPTLFIEILIKQPVPFSQPIISCCVYPSNCPLKSWQNNSSRIGTFSAGVVYILQIVHWNPDKTTVSRRVCLLAWLCISFKLFIEILIKQQFPLKNIDKMRCVYPSNCSLKSW